MAATHFKDTTVYKKAFAFSDSDMENSETAVWIDFAFACKYIDEIMNKKLLFDNEEVGKLLHHMIINPEKY